MPIPSVFGLCMCITLAVFSSGTLLVREQMMVNGKIKISASFC